MSGIEPRRCRLLSPHWGFSAAEMAFPRRGVGLTYLGLRPRLTSGAASQRGRGHGPAGVLAAVPVGDGALGFARGDARDFGCATKLARRSWRGAGEGRLIFVAGEGLLHETGSPRAGGCPSSTSRGCRGVRDIRAECPSAPARGETRGCLRAENPPCRSRSAF